LGTEGIEDHLPILTCGKGRQERSLLYIEKKKRKEKKTKDRGTEDKWTRLLIRPALMSRTNLTGLIPCVSKFIVAHRPAKGGTAHS
jgi:hypothetical protein